MEIDNDKSPTPHIKKFFNNFKQSMLRKGQIFIHPDIPISGVFFIEEGLVKSYTINENGDERILLIYKNNDILPLTKIFDEPISNLYCECMSDVNMRCADKDLFSRFLKNNNDALFELANYLTKITKKMAERIENLSYIKANDRLTYRLLVLAKLLGKKDITKNVIRIGINQGDLANSIAMARETVNRELEKLGKENILEYIHHEIKIKDIDRLRDKLCLFG